MEMITITGPTACGKTRVAVALAKKIDGEIISGDSRQVYRRMDIGTGKDLCEYIIDGKNIPFHLINICEPGTKYNLFEYQNDFHKSFDDIVSRGKTPILCGGTGLYIESVIKGYRLSPVPQNDVLRAQLADKTLAELTEMLELLKQKNGSNMHNVSDVDTPQRAIRAIEIEEHNLRNPLPERDMRPINSLVFAIDIPREERRERISARLAQRLDNGMIEEVKGLIDSGIPAEDLIYYGLEYKYVTEYVIGKTTYEKMFTSLETAIHQFAKRQMTWLRGMERRGMKITWIPWKPTTEKMVENILEEMEKQSC